MTSARHEPVDARLEGTDGEEEVRRFMGLRYLFDGFTHPEVPMLRPVYRAHLDLFDLLDKAQLDNLTRC